MIIRMLTSDDLHEFCKVSSSAFIWKVDWKTEQWHNENCILGAFCDDNRTLMAEIEIFHKHQSFCGKFINANGVGGVASKPEYRRSGSVRALFEYFFKLCDDNNEAVSMLYPFSSEYYRKFGYEAAVRSLSLTTPFSSLRNIDRNNSVMLFEGENNSELLELYNRIALGTNLMYKRNDNTYFSDKPYETNVYTYIWLDIAGKPAAYATIKPNRESSVLFVDELGYLNKTALVGMLGFLRAYDGNFKDICFSSLPLNSPVPELLGDYSDFNTKLKYNGALRVQNISVLLEANTYPEFAGRFSLKFSGSTEINNGIFDVEYSKAKAKVTRRDSGEYDLALTPASAAHIILSGNSFTRERLDYLQDIEIRGDISGFLAAFPQRECEYHDGF